MPSKNKAELAGSWGQALQEGRIPFEHLLSNKTLVKSNGCDTVFLAAMFGALNRFIGRLDGDPNDQNVAGNAAGFQVVKNTIPEVPLEPWFDFIIGINGRNLVCS
jgi:hypothetical protein